MGLSLKLKMQNYYNKITMNVYQIEKNDKWWFGSKIVG
jgi:hypothetical protein